MHFAAFKNHIGFYPTSSGISKFKNELSSYEISKGTVRFPIDEPIPFDLVKRIVKYRAKENLNKGDIGRVYPSSRKGEGRVRACQ